MNLSRRAPVLLLAAALLGGCSSSAAPSSASMAPPEPGVPGDPLVEAGDIVEVVGTDVFILNQWKGLLIVSLADPTKPSLTARVPIGGAGVPLEMFVVPGYVLALVRGVNDYLPCDSCYVGVASLTDSQLVVIDVGTPAAAAVVARVGIPGQVRDARLAGDVLYAVSNNGKLVVTSTDVSNPAVPRDVDRIDVGVDGSQTLLHMRDGALYAVSTDGQTGPIGECGGPGQADGCTFISAVDVSAPDGRLRLGATYAMTGHMIDRDSIDLYQGILRVMVRESSLVAAHPAKLRTFQAGSAAQLEPLASLLLGNSVAQSLTAVRFDGARAFAVTSDQGAPLYTIDLSNPQAPQVVGQVSEPGSLDHLEIDGDRLVALGADSAGVGTGASQLQLSLYDVSDLTAPRLLARTPFGGGQMQMLTGNPDGLGSVFQIVDPRGLVLIPYDNVFVSADWSYQRTEPHVQLVSLSGQTLALGGSISHPGDVLRAVPFGATQLITLSQQALQVVDVSNALAPQSIGEIELSRNVAAAAIAVDGTNVVALEVDPSSGAATLSEVPADTLDVSAPGLATLPVSTLQADLFLNGSLATLVSRRATSPSSMVEVFDVSAASAIARRGSVLFDAATTFDPKAATSPFAPPLAATRMVAMAGPSLVAMVDQEVPYDAFTGPGSLVLVDASNPDRPVVAGRLPFAGVRNIGILTAAAGSLSVVTEESAPGATSDQYFDSAFFLHTVDLSDAGAPRLIKKVSLPGSPLATTDALVFLLDGMGTLYVDGLNPTGDLTPLGTRPDFQNGTAAIEGMRAVLADGDSLEIANLTPGGGTQLTTFLPDPIPARVAALAGGRAILDSGEVYDTRPAPVRFVTLLPRDSTDNPPDVQVELSSATGLPVRAIFAGGFRGIQAISLE